MDEPNPGDTPIAWAIKNNSGGKRRMREAPVIPFFADQEPLGNWDNGELVDGSRLWPEESMIPAGGLGELASRTHPSITPPRVARLTRPRSKTGSNAPRRRSGAHRGWYGEPPTSQKV